MNSRSAAKPGAIDSLSAYVDHNDISVIFLTETWFTESVKDAELSLNNKFHPIRLDRPTRGGGVCILIKRNINIVPVPSCGSGEYVAVDLIGSSARVRLACFYISNAGDCQTRLSRTTSCAETLKTLCSIDHPILIAGDFNFPSISWPRLDLTDGIATKESIFVECCEFNNLLQLVDFSTHASGSTLDLVLTTNPELISNLQSTCPPIISDHLGISFELLFTTNTNAPPPPPLNFRKMDIRAIEEHLHMLNWRNLLASCASVDEMYNLFVDICTSLIDSFVPETSCFPERDPLKGVLSRIEQKLDRGNSDTSILARKLSRVSLRQRVLYEHKLDFRNARAFFRYSNSRLKEHQPVPTLTLGASTYITAKEKADHLGSHFVSTFNPPQRSAPTPQIIRRGPISYPDSSVVFSEQEVFKHTSKLSSKSSHTPDRVPPVFFKTFRWFLSEPIALILQRSYEDGEVPELFRTGIITPVFKEGKKDSAANYRPVSQGVMPCLLFEKILTAHINRYLRLNDFLDNNQHGFTPGKSTSTQLLCMTQKFAEFMNSDTPFHSIYFDLKGAFDKVDHARLIEKLTLLGLHQNTITWCQRYLDRRSFRVRVDGVLSQAFPAPSGVPQGGSLSPLLYSIFVLDISHYIPKSIDYLLYADDIKLFGPVRDEKEKLVLQAGIDGIAKWCVENHMIVSTPKCAVLHSKLSSPSKADYILNGEPLPCTQTIRDLGVEMSADLDFSLHINNVIRSARCTTNCIFRCFAVNTPDFYLRLYNALVVSKLTYCVPVWLPYKRKHMDTLQSVERYFLRRLRLRCGPTADAVSLQPISDVLANCDTSILRKLLSLGLRDYFFDVSVNNLRSSCTVRSKSIARRNSTNSTWSWRICSKVHGGEIPSQLFLYPSPNPHEPVNLCTN